MSTESCTELGVKGGSWAFMPALGNQEHLSSGGFTVRVFSSWKCLSALSEVIRVEKNKVQVVPGGIAECQWNVLRLQRAIGWWMVFHGWGLLERKTGAVGENYEMNGGKILWSTWLVYCFYLVVLCLFLFCYFQRQRFSPEKNLLWIRI